MTAPNVPTPLPIPLTAPPARSVLIVDDEPVIRRIAQVALTGAGFTVAEAADIVSASAAVRTAERPFDLILLDLTLPDGDGGAVIAVVRQHAPGTRVMVVSGAGQMDPAEIGADHYLAKPFTKTSLLLAVNLSLTATGQTKKS
jgi:DNA-binding response OmpR family regulator